MATDKPRFTITLDPKILSRVLEYKDINKLSTQSKAIQRLIEIGIQETVSSQSFGFRAKQGEILEESELELVEKYRQLTELNKGRVLQQIDTLLDAQSKAAAKSINSVG